jgi:hypothetical protein
MLFENSPQQSLLDSDDDADSSESEDDDDDGGGTGEQKVAYTLIKSRLVELLTETGPLKRRQFLTLSGWCFCR